MISFSVFLGAMDSFARGLKNAAKLIEDGTLESLVKVSFFASFCHSFVWRRLSFFMLQRTCDTVPRDDTSITSF